MLCLIKSVETHVYKMFLRMLVVYVDKHRMIFSERMFSVHSAALKRVHTVY